MQIFNKCEKYNFEYPILPSRKYDVGIVDPNWFYNNRLTGKGRTKFGSGASGKYALLKAEALAEIPIGNIFKDNSVIFLWITCPLMYETKSHKTNARYLEKALKSLDSIDSLIDRFYETQDYIFLEKIKHAKNRAMTCLESFKVPHEARVVIEGWGFNYSSVAYVWLKTCKGDNTKFRKNPAHYTSSNAELVLICVRGKGMTPTQIGGKAMTDQIIIEPIKRHSEKPKIHRNIDLIYNKSKFKKIELFARDPYPGWDNWGLEAPIMREGDLNYGRHGSLYGRDRHKGLLVGKDSVREWITSLY